jgi:hypothetical protein
LQDAPVRGRDDRARWRIAQALPWVGEPVKSVVLAAFTVLSPGTPGLISLMRLFAIPRDGTAK